MAPTYPTHAAVRTSAAGSLRSSTNAFVWRSTGSVPSASAARVSHAAAEAQRTACVPASASHWIGNASVSTSSAFRRTSAFVARSDRHKIGSYSCPSASSSSGSAAFVRRGVKARAQNTASRATGVEVCQLTHSLTHPASRTRLTHSPGSPTSLTSPSHVRRLIACSTCNTRRTAVPVRATAHSMAACIRC